MMEYSYIEVDDGTVTVVWNDGVCSVSLVVPAESAVLTCSPYNKALPPITLKGKELTAAKVVEFIKQARCLEQE